MGGFNNPEIAKQAGRKGKPGKHTKTQQWEQLGDFITKAGAEKATRILNELPDEEYLDQYGKLLNYFKPKISYNINKSEDVPLARIEIKEIGND